MQDLKLKTVLLLLTYRCNLKCKYCYYHIGDLKHSGIMEINNSNRELTNTQIINKVILPLKKLKPKQIIFSGGEPLLREDLPELLHTTLNQGIDSIVQTNFTTDIGSLLSSYRILKNVYFQVSLDGFEQQHDMQRGAGSYKKIMSNLLLLMDAYQKNSLEPKISISTTISKKMHLI